MSESSRVSGNLLFIKDSLMQFVSSGKQNVLSFRILIGISPADTLSEGKFLTTFLTVASFVRSGKVGMISTFQRNRHFKKVSVNKTFTHVQEQKKSDVVATFRLHSAGVKSRLKMHFHYLILAGRFKFFFPRYHAILYPG